MHIAVQTISWGPHHRDINHMLEEVKNAGYSGVEFAQHPRELAPPSELHDMLQRHGLTLVGIAGGSLAEKVVFVKEFVACGDQYLVAPVAKNIQTQSARSLVSDPPYIYIDEWDEEQAVQALDAGLVLAIHPHMFKAIQTAREAEALLETHPGLRFLPDTAHLTIAGENVTEVLERNFDRLAAIHLKDWTAEFGRAYQFYARGFVVLGAGDVPLREVGDVLKFRGYRGWIVVEQDTSPHPLESAKASLQWLLANY